MISCKLKKLCRVQKKCVETFIHTVTSNDSPVPKGEILSQTLAELFFPEVRCELVNTYLQQCNRVCLVFTWGYCLKWKICSSIVFLKKNELKNFRHKIWFHVFDIKCSAYNSPMSCACPTSCEDMLMICVNLKHCKLYHYLHLN